MDQEKIQRALVAINCQLSVDEAERLVRGKSWINAGRLRTWQVLCQCLLGRSVEEIVAEFGICRTRANDLIRDGFLALGTVSGKQVCPTWRYFRRLHEAAELGEDIVLFNLRDAVALPKGMNRTAVTLEAARQVIFAQEEGRGRHAGQNARDWAIFVRYLEGGKPEELTAEFNFTVTESTRYQATPYENARKTVYRIVETVRLGLGGNRHTPIGWYYREYSRSGRELGEISFQLGGTYAHTHREELRSKKAEYYRQHADEIQANRRGMMVDDYRQWKADREAARQKAREEKERAQQQKADERAKARDLRKSERVKQKEANRLDSAVHKAWMRGDQHPLKPLVYRLIGAHSRVDQIRRQYNISIFELATEVEEALWQAGIDENHPDARRVASKSLSTYVTSVIRKELPFSSLDSEGSEGDILEFADRQETPAEESETEQVLRQAKFQLRLGRCRNLILASSNGKGEKRAEVFEAYLFSTEPSVAAFARESAKELGLSESQVKSELDAALKMVRGAFGGDPDGELTWGGHRVEGRQMPNLSGEREFDLGSSMMRARVRQLLADRDGHWTEGDEEWAWCGLCANSVRLAEATIDHVIPQSRGGSSALSNLQLAHADCNEEKSDRLPAMVVAYQAARKE